MLFLPLVEVLQERLAGRGLQVKVQALHEGGLSRPALPDDAQHLAGVDVQGDVVCGVDRAALGAAVLFELAPAKAVRAALSVAHGEMLHAQDRRFLKPHLHLERTSRQ